MVDVLVHAANTSTGLFDLAAVAEQAGLTVVRVDAERPDAVAAVVRAARRGVAYRSPGGLLARAMTAGAAIELVGADADWFVDLPAEVTGRKWLLTDATGARREVMRGPTFVKLAGAKFRALPAKRYATVVELDEALSAVHASRSLRLLVTRTWLPIHSEYRTFVIGRDVVACSPYRIEDEPWTPLLRTHRASFHDEAAAFTSGFVASLSPDDVPPTAVLDIARLDDGRFVVLEVNHVWSSGLYGCDPKSVLRAVVAAAATTVTDADRWRWRPDSAVDRLHR